MPPNKLLTIKSWIKNNRGIIFPVIFLFALVLLVASGFALINNYFFAPQKNLISVEPKEEYLVSAITDLKLVAISAYVKELNTGKVIYEKNAREPRPLASIVKLMTALYARSNIDPKTQVAINDNDLATEGEYNLSVGERFSLKNLIDYTLVNSSNDTASALASAVSIKRAISQNQVINEINAFAKKIGMQNTTFQNVTGLDLDELTPGATGTATDVATLLEYIIKNYPELLEETNKDNIRIVSNTGAIHNLSNTNEAIDKMPGIIASKTGYTEIAGGNLAIVTDLGLNNPYIIVVLGSTQEGRFADVEQIINHLIK